VTLTEKDAEFLVTLKLLLEERQLRIELKDTGHKYLVLRQNYGDRVEAAFNITRQGVRWRFQRLFSQVYVEAYQTILWIESNFGTELRAMAMEVARDRTNGRKKALERSGRGRPSLKEGDAVG
jgi:hypothetical protein